MSGRHRQAQRGAGPKDERLFGASAWPILRTAVSDLCWLLNRGYALRSAVDLVGNLLLDVAATAGWDWRVELVFNADRVLATTDQIVATSDGAILDRCQRSINLTRLVIASHVPNARTLEL